MGFYSYMNTLQASSDTEVFYTSLQALVQLSSVVGAALNAHLKTLLPQVQVACLS